MFNRAQIWGKGLFCLLLSLCFIVFFSKNIYAAAGINHTINFQGKLVNSDGTNVTDGSYSIVFSLYTVSSGGSAAWTETDSVTAKDGVFRVPLGAGTSFSSASIDFNSDTYYLGIKVGSDAEMTPRVQFTAVPYAFNAEKVNGLTVTNNGTNTLNIAAGKTLTANSSLILAGTDNKTLTVTGSTTLADNIITFGGTETLTLAATKNVSFADAFTTSGAFPLTLTSSATTNATLPSGTITLVDLASTQTLTNKTIGSTGLTFSGATTDITTLSNQDFDIVPNGTGKIGLFTNGTLGASLDVRANSGTLAIASVSGATSFAGLVVDNSGVGDIFTASSSGLNRFVITQNGNVGIGTTNPTDVLDVERNGDAYLKAVATVGSGQIAGLKLQRGTTSDGFTDFNIYDSAGQLFFDDSSNSNTTNILTLDSENVGIHTGSNTTLATLDVRRNSYTTPVASFSGSTGKATLVVDQSGGVNGGDIFTASSSGTTRFTVQQNGAVVIGSSTNGLTFDPVNAGPTYSGTGRPTKQIILSPEYAGAILTASGSASTNGNMTSDASPSANFRNYYQWKSSQSSLQDYTVAVRTTLPKDFSAWATSGNAVTVDLYTNLKASGSNKIDILAYKVSDGSVVVVDQTQSSGATDKTWITRGYTSSQVQSLSAGDTIVFYLKMYSKDNNDVLVGDIGLNYLAKF